jgi:hypothetical protein
MKHYSRLIERRGSSAGGNGSGDDNGYSMRAIFHVITAADAANRYFDLPEDVSAELKQNTVLTVETDVQAPTEYEVVLDDQNRLRRVSWAGKWLDTDPPMSEGWRCWVLFWVEGGESSSSSGIHTYTHNQITPSMVWNIQHNLNRKYVMVTTVNTNGEDILGSKDWPASTYNLLVVRFGMPVAGTAFVVA